MNCFLNEESGRYVLSHKKRHSVEFVSLIENQSIFSWNSKISLERRE